MGERGKRILFQLGFVLTACVIIEIVLRFMGYQPGDLRPNWLYFKPVDSLYVINDFVTNQEGLLVANAEYWASQKIHINNPGFRTKEFEELDTGKKKILVLGDSFAWGLSASPLQDSSFCDILQRESNYEILNTGIPAAGPPQYAKIAGTYIPQLKPDMVLIAFYSGNDLMRTDQPITPGRPYYYWTNAGAVVADIDGHHFNNAQDAYNYLASEKYFLKNPNGWYKKVISKSALLSRLYAGKFRLQEKLEYERARKDASITKKYLYNIVETATRDSIPVRFVWIPEAKEAKKSLADYQNRYKNLLYDEKLKGKWLLPAPGPQNFVTGPDGHLNNSGHRLYAEYLKSYLDTRFLEADSLGR